MDLKEHIRSIQDYPKKGIVFRDITTLIKNEKEFKESIDQIVKRTKKFEFDKSAVNSFSDTEHNVPIDLI